MTQRKPPGTSFTSWIDRQISEAAQRGAFDGLPGAGKPLPKRADGDDGQSWLRDYLRREGVSAEELLPTPLKLRKEAERLTGTVHDLGSEQEVRDAVAELNRRIIQWRRIPVGPPVFLSLVDEDTLVRKWQDARASSPPPPSSPPPSSLPPPAQPPAPAGHGPAGAPTPTSGWWRPLRRRRQPAG
jgi:Domain of unknown function (DUF1992)